MTTFADRAHALREHEAHYETQLPKNTWLTVRLDGRGFSGFTEEHYEKPFDARFHDAMSLATQAVMRECDAVYGYTGSDEVTIVLPPWWNGFDRRLQKVVTSLASSLSVQFSLASGHAATFDARVAAWEKVEQVVELLAWRKADVERCAVNTAAYWTLRQAGQSARSVTRTLNKMPTPQKLELLLANERPFAEYAAWMKQGVGMWWQEVEREGRNPLTGEMVTVMRRVLEAYEELGTDRVFSTEVTLYLERVEKQHSAGR